MVTAVNVGYQFMGFLVLFVLMAKQILRWSPATLGWSFMAIPIVNTLVMYYVIPPLIARSRPPSRFAPGPPSPPFASVLGAPLLITPATLLAPIGH